MTPESQNNWDIQKNSLDQQMFEIREEAIKSREKLLLDYKKQQITDRTKHDLSTLFSLEDTIRDTSFRDLIEESISIEGFDLEKYSWIESENKKDFLDTFTIEYINYIRNNTSKAHQRLFAHKKLIDEQTFYLPIPEKILNNILQNTVNKLRDKNINLDINFNIVKDNRRLVVKKKIRITWEEKTQNITKKIEKNKIPEDTHSFKKDKLGTIIKGWKMVWSILRDNKLKYEAPNVTILWWNYNPKNLVEWLKIYNKKVWDKNYVFVWSTKEQEQEFYKLTKLRNSKKKENKEKKEYNVIEHAINLIQNFEWFHEVSYSDYKQYSRWYWTKAPWKWAKITKSLAKQELKREVNKINQYITKEYWNTLTSNQKVSLISFYYNLWTGTRWKENFTAKLRNFSKWKIKATKVAEHMKKFKRAWWKVIDWLVKRRNAEAELFIA